MAFTDKCGVPQPHSVQVLDNWGGPMPFFITDSDDDHRVIDMSIETLDYNPGVYFVINIETAGDIAVQLVSGQDFIITAVQAGAYAGLWYPALIKKVYKVAHGVTTTGTFSVGK